MKNNKKMDPGTVFALCFKGPLCKSITKTQIFQIGHVKYPGGWSGGGHFPENFGIFGIFGFLLLIFIRNLEKHDFVCFGFFVFFGISFVLLLFCILRIVFLKGPLKHKVWTPVELQKLYF